MDRIIYISMGVIAAWMLSWKGSSVGVFGIPCLQGLPGKESIALDDIRRTIGTIFAYITMKVFISFEELRRCTYGCFLGVHQNNHLRLVLGHDVDERAVLYK